MEWFACSVLLVRGERDDASLKLRHLLMRTFKDADEA
jgi:hypothetical protein